MLRKSLLVVCAVGFLSALVPGTATAQDNNWNQRTYFTFSAPVELPGKTLPAGTYLFKIVDSPSNRHVVQVFDKDEKMIHATILAIPAQRLEPSDEPEVRFMEVAANQPPAIRTWWFPGRTIGHEFIYPKEQAMRLARGSSSSVLTVATDSTATETMREAELNRATAAGEMTASTTTTTTEVSGTAFPGRATAETEVAVTTQQAPTTVPQSTTITQREVATAPAPPMSTESVTTTRTELPRTATFLPLVGLVGLGSLAAATVLRSRRK
jgi:hypothetical protein